MTKEIEDLLFYLAGAIGWFMVGWLTNDVFTKSIEVLTK